MNRLQHLNLLGVSLAWSVQLMSLLACDDIRAARLMLPDLLCTYNDWICWMPLDMHSVRRYLSLLRLVALFQLCFKKYEPEAHGREAPYDSIASIPVPYLFGNHPRVV